MYCFVQKYLNIYINLLLITCDPFGVVSKLIYDFLNL
jgi:hypothetical protein